jgi:L-seryl-tRNA(Ser) seleniumtransferase
MAERPASELLRAIPAVDRLLEEEVLAPLLGQHSRGAVVEELRALLDGLRQQARQGDLEAQELAAEAIARRLDERLAERRRPYYRRVINATGVVLHTGLGRAPLAPAAVAALAQTAGGAQRLELDLASGERGGREEGCAALLRRLTGAEAATVVNNNAAATLIALATLARGKRVLLSRGEMVEIGGSYRVPEILRESGATLAEVGTTNRTHLADYEAAIDEQTGLILKVHTSNYRIQGFTAEVGIGELVELGLRHHLPVVHDLGSGCLVEAARWNLGGEPEVARSVAAGADLVCFSGDKLLGGPQAGLLVGRAEAVARCRRHPLFRALRPGRLIYTALEATLRLYREGSEGAVAAIPALARLNAEPAALRRRAEALGHKLEELPGANAEVVPVASQAGSGSMPAEELASWGVRLAPQRGTAGELATALRLGEPAVVARLKDDALLLDARTLDDGDIEPLAGAVGRALAGG